MLQAVSALLRLSITVIWAPFPKIIIRWVAALCLECQLGSDVPKSINYAAQNMKSFNREADVTSLFRVFLPLQTWQSWLSLWSSAKMRRNCQRKLLTSCVPCDKVSQALTGTMSVDSHREAWGASQQLELQRRDMWSNDTGKVYRQKHKIFHIRVLKLLLNAARLFSEEHSFHIATQNLSLSLPYSLTLSHSANQMLTNSAAL